MTEEKKEIEETLAPLRQAIQRMATDKEMGAAGGGGGREEIQYQRHEGAG